MRKQRKCARMNHFSQIFCKTCWMSSESPKAVLPEVVVPSLSWPMSLWLMSEPCTLSMWLQAHYTDNQKHPAAVPASLAAKIRLLTCARSRGSSCSRASRRCAGSVASPHRCLCRSPPCVAAAALGQQCTDETHAGGSWGALQAPTAHLRLQLPPPPAWPAQVPPVALPAASTVDESRKEVDVAPAWSRPSVVLPLVMPICSPSCILSGHTLPLEQHKHGHAGNTWVAPKSRWSACR